MSDDLSILDEFRRDRKTADAQAVDDEIDRSILEEFRRKESSSEKRAPTKILVTPDRSRADVVNASGFNNRMVSDVPIVGPLFDKATAAAGAAIQPLVSKESADKSFGQRYQENLLLQDTANQRYAEEHAVASTAADITGASMLLGPMAQTGIGARMIGLRGNSLGSRVYQGAAGMGALETGNQLLKGNNPLDQGLAGPVPVAMVGGAIGPMLGEAIASGGNRLLDGLPRTTGELAGVNSVGRNMLVNAFEGETPASVAEAKRRFGSSGMSEVIIAHPRP